MTATALRLVLVVALLHAVRNPLAERAGGGPVLVWLRGTTATVLLTPLVIVLFAVRRPEVGSAGLGLLLASAVIHVLYFAVSQRGYQLGDLSIVYPVARGTGPVLTTIGAVALALG